MNFRKGSVIVDFTVWMETTPQDRTFVLRAVIKNIYSFMIGGHYVDVMSVTISGVCGTYCKGPTIHVFVIVNLLNNVVMSS